MMIVGASASAALTVVLLFSVRDCRATTRTAIQTATTPATPTPTPTMTPIAPATRTPTAAPSFSEPAPTGAVVTTTSGELDAGDDGGAPMVLATPTVAPAPPPPPPPVVAEAEPPEAGTAAKDAGAVATAEPAEPREEPTTLAGRIAKQLAGEDAGARPNPWAPPPMTAGAGSFVTEAPYWSASSFTSNPDAGAGRFMTEAPPWSASAFTSDPNAGAGPFTTERNIPAYGVWPYWPALLFAQ